MHKQNERKVIAFVEDGTFEIDSQGRIWRLKQCIGQNGRAFDIPRRRAEFNCTNGYLDIQVITKGKRISARAHRLVWQYFNGDIPKGLTINHKNGIKDDNRPANLEVVTYSENHKHAFRIGLRKNRAGEKHPQAKLTNRQIRRIRRLCVSGRFTQTALATKFKVSQNTISKIVNEKRYKNV